MKKQILASVFLILIASSQVFALDYTEYSRSFSDRSQIMRHLSGEDKINQEDKDNLVARKLRPDTKCIMEQIKKNNYDNLKALLDAKIDPNQGYMSDYPIYYAAKLNRTEMVKLLYDYGAKLDKSFYSELYEAVRNKNSELAQYLIDRGAKVNYTDSLTTNTILYTALKNNMNEIAKQIIQNGAYADAKSVKIIKKKKLFDLVEESLK